MTKQYIAIRKTDLFYSSMGLCGNFTKFAKKSISYFWACIENTANYTLVYITTI